MLDPPNDSALCACSWEGIPKEMNWGISKMNIVHPHHKKMHCFAKIEQNRFVSSDGTTVTIWTPDKIIQQISLPALSLAYIPEFNQIVSFCSKSTHLHFIRNKEPYAVTVHNTPFSNKIITEMIYFEKQRILISSGQGIMITKFNMPFYILDTVPQPNILVFEKINEIYTDEIFTPIRKPVPIREHEQFLVWFDRSIVVHDLNGNKIKEIPNITTSPITFCSFYCDPDFLCISDDGGTVSVLQYDSTSVNIPSKFSITKSTTIFASLLDKNFFITVSLDNLLTLYCIATMHVIDTIHLDLPPQFVYLYDDVLIIQSNMTLMAYKVTIFTKTFSSTITNAINLQKYYSTTNEPRLTAFCENGLTLVIDSKDGTRNFGVESNICSSRVDFSLLNTNVMVDGEAFVKTNAKESFAFVFQDYKCFVVERGNERSIPMKKLMNPTFEFDINDFSGDVIDMEKNKIVTIVRTKENEIMALEKTGHFHFYNTNENKDNGLVFSQIKDVITAVTCFSLKLVIISRYKKLSVFDIQQRRIVSEVPAPSFTSLMMLNEDTIICGGIDGSIEKRSVPQFVIESKSKTKKNASAEFGFSDGKISEIFNIKTAVIKLDYSRTRKCVLSLTNDGVISLFNTDCDVVARMCFPFMIHSACFLDGFGSIALSAFKIIFKIDWRDLFVWPIEAGETQLDDFDLRVKDKPKEERKINNITLTDAEISRVNKKYLHKRENVPLNERGRAPRKKKELEPVEADVFEDLVVEEEELKTKYFVQSRMWDFDYKPKRKEATLADILNASAIQYNSAKDNDDNNNDKPVKEKKTKKKVSCHTRKAPKKKENVCSKKNVSGNKETIKKSVKANNENDEQNKEKANDDNKQKKVTSVNNKSKKKTSSNVKQPTTPIRKSVRARVSLKKKAATKEANETQEERPPAIKVAVDSHEDDDDDDDGCNEIVFQIQEPSTSSSNTHRSSGDDSLISLQSVQFNEPEEVPSIGEVTMDEFQKYLEQHSTVISDASSSNSSRRSSRRSSFKQSISSNSLFSTSSESIPAIPIFPTTPETSETSIDADNHSRETEKTKEQSFNVKRRGYSPSPQRKSVVIRKIEKEKTVYPETPKRPKAPLLRIMNFGPCDTVKLPPEKLVDERTKRMMRIIQSHCPQTRVNIQDSVSAMMKMIKEETMKRK